MNGASDLDAYHEEQIIAVLREQWLGRALEAS